MYKFILSLILISSMFVACEDNTIPERLDVGNDVVKSNEYFENLRAYKRSDHQVAFGWFGGWNAEGPGNVSYLNGLPDSIDMVSVWGNWSNLSDAKIKDMRYVQEVKGTKVLLCWIVANVGDQLGMPKEYWTEDGKLSHDESIRKYARAIVDTVYKYGYDGFDIDYEPNYGAPGNIATNKENMYTFVEEMGKHLGPKSGSDKLLLIDGEPEYLKSEAGKFFNFYISQAYGSRNGASIQGRINRMLHLEEFDSKKYICTENFESYWQDGGVPFTLPNGKIVPSLIGMAYWNPTQGRKGGVGSYHMEYEFPHNPDYKYIREAIQIMNPAVQ